MRLSLRSNLLGTLLLATTRVAATAHADEPKYYVHVRSVIETDGVQSGIADEALEHLRKELKKRPECTLESPVAAGASDDELRAALKAKKLKGVELSLKIMAVEYSLDPPPPGKQYRVMLRGMKVSLFGNTIPDRTLSLGGDGESTIKIELGKRSEVEDEKKKLLLEASQAAMIQAVDMTLRKLDTPPTVDKKAPKKTKK